MELQNVTIGSEIEVNSGAMYPLRRGFVVGSEIIPATKWFAAEFRLIAEIHYTDDSGEPCVAKHYITSFTERGIGCRLVKLAEPKVAKKKSPWAQ